MAESLSLAPKPTSDSAYITPAPGEFKVCSFRLIFSSHKTLALGICSNLKMILGSYYTRTYHISAAHALPMPKSQCSTCMTRVQLLSIIGQRLRLRTPAPFEEPASSASCGVGAAPERFDGWGLAISRSLTRSGLAAGLRQPPPPPPSEVPSPARNAHAPAPATATATAAQ